MTPNGFLFPPRPDNDGKKEAPRCGPSPRRIFAPRVPPARLRHDAWADLYADSTSAPRQGSGLPAFEDMMRVLLPAPSATQGVFLGSLTPSAERGIDACDPIFAPSARPGAAGATQRLPPLPPMPAAPVAPSDAWVNAFVEQMSAMEPAEAQRFFCENTPRLHESIRQRLYPAYAEHLVRLGHFKPAAALCRRMLGGGLSAHSSLFAGGVASHEAALREQAQVLVWEALRARQWAGDALMPEELDELRDLETGRLRVAESSPFFERYEACLLVMPELAPGSLAGARHYFASVHQ